MIKTWKRIPRLKTLDTGRTRILRIVARMNVGGPAIQITQLMEHLSDANFEQLLLTGQCDEGEMDYLKLNKISLRSKQIAGLGRSIGIRSDLQAFFQIRRIMREFKPDIVHTHTAKAGFLGRISSLTLFANHKRVHTFHGHLLYGYFGKFTLKLVIFAEKFLAYQSHALVSVGETVKYELIEAGIGRPEIYNVINPGITIQEIASKESSLRYFGLEEHPFTVGWIGRLVEVKAPSRILEIARLSLRGGKRMRFLIIGDGPLKESLRLEAQKEGLPIEFLGWQSQIEKVMPMLDVVLLTSINEGTPISIIQSQMSGVPVVATNVGSVSEVLLHGISGYCMKYSAEVFYATLLQLIDDSDLRESMGRKAKEFSQDKFSLGKFIEQYTHIYNELIN